MNDSIWVWAAALFVVLGGALAVVYLRSVGEPVQPTEAMVDPVEMPAERVPTEPVRPPSRAAIPEPVPEEAPAPPLPELDESDEEVVDRLAQLLGPSPAEQFLVPENIVRHMVVTIDNMAREHVTERQRPLQPVPGQFVAVGEEEGAEAEEEGPIVLSSENYARYRPLVQSFADVDTGELVASYRRLYPLFREAYEDLGHASGDFNFRLLEVIDHLLETPEVRGPIRLVRPNVLYEFEDEKLEALSPGQKLLIRMGEENAAIVKAKLREIRDELI